MNTDYYNEFIDELAKEYADNAIDGFVELKACGLHPAMPYKGEIYTAKNWMFGATLDEAMAAALKAKLDIIFVD